MGNMDTLKHMSRVKPGHIWRHGQRWTHEGKLKTVTQRKMKPKETYGHI